MDDRQPDRRDAMLLPDLLDVRKQHSQVRPRRLRIGSDTAGQEQTGADRKRRERGTG